MVASTPHRACSLAPTGANVLGVLEALTQTAHRGRLLLAWCGAAEHLGPLLGLGGRGLSWGQHSERGADSLGEGAVEIMSRSCTTREVRRRYPGSLQKLCKDKSLSHAK